MKNQDVHHLFRWWTSWFFSEVQSPPESLHSKKKPLSKAAFDCLIDKKSSFIKISVPFKDKTALKRTLHILQYNESVNLFPFDSYLCLHQYIILIVLFDFFFQITEKFGQKSRKSVKNILVKILNTVDFKGFFCYNKK